MSHLRFRTLTFFLLLLLSLVLLAVFSVTTFMQASEVIDQQSEEYGRGLALRYEERLRDYLEQVEAEAQAVSADTARIGLLYNGNTEAFQRSLSRWEEGYENIHYDFVLFAFPGQTQCHLSRTYVPELGPDSCQSLVEAHQGISYQGWSILRFKDETLAVYSIPLDMPGSGKVVGQLMAGVRLAENRYLLNSLVSSKDPLESLQLRLNGQTLARLQTGDSGEGSSRIEVLSPGLTALGEEVSLQLQLNDNSQPALREGLSSMLVYGVFLALLASMLVAFWLSSSVDRQLQQLIGFTRLANRDREARWPETNVLEFYQIGREVLEIVHCLKEREHELEAVNKELSASITEKRSILQHLIKAQENERKRLSNELHDDMAQLLVAVKMNLQLLRDEMPESSDVNLDQAISLVNTIYDNVYHRIRTLRPYELSDFGLEAGLRGLPAVSILEQMDYAVEIDIDQTRPVCPEVTSNLYRIAQEALSNVIKYAKGTYVMIRLKDEPEGLRLTIADDGKGGDAVFEKPQSDQGGFGLLAIRERAEFLQAELTLNTAEGVSIDVLVPVAHAYMDVSESEASFLSV